MAAGGSSHGRGCRRSCGCAAGASFLPAQTANVGGAGGSWWLLLLGSTRRNAMHHERHDTTSTSPNTMHAAHALLCRLQMMEQYRARPDLSVHKYLTLILVQGASLNNPSLQQAAGSVLRTAIESDWADSPGGGVPGAAAAPVGKLDAETKATIKAYLLHSLALPTARLRHTGANIIATIMRHEELYQWPELLQVLIACKCQLNALLRERKKFLWHRPAHSLSPAAC